MADTNTTEPGAHPGAASEPSLTTPDGQPEVSLLGREVSADGVVRVNAGDSVGINLGMGVVDDGKRTPVSLAAPTVSDTSGNREVFLMESEKGQGEVDEAAAAATAATTPATGKAAKGTKDAG